MGISTAILDSDRLKTEQRIVAKIVLIFLLMSILYVLAIVFKDHYDYVFQFLYPDERYTGLNSGFPAAHSPQPGLMRMLSKGIKYDYVGAFLLNCICIPGFAIAGYGFSKLNPPSFRSLINRFLLVNLVISIAMAISAVLYKNVFRSSPSFTPLPYASISWWRLAISYRFIAMLPFTFAAYWIGWKIMQKSGSGKSVPQ